MNHEMFALDGKVIL